MHTTIYPLSPNINNEAEKIIYYKLSEFLTDKHVTYYNYTVRGKEFDFCIIEKNKAIFIIEVKGWESIQITDVKDNNTIKYRDSFNNIKEWTSPFKQVNGYRFDMLNEIKNKFNKNPLVIGMVCYPFITLNKYKEKNLDIISPQELTILKDDLLDSKSLKNKFNEAIKLMKHKKVYDELNKDLITKIRGLYESDFQINNTVNIENDVPLYERDLIKNNITQYNNVEKHIELHNNKLQKDLKPYSVLKYIKGNKKDEEIFSLSAEVISLWKQGVKITLASDNDEVLYKIKSYIENNLGYLKRYDNFNIRDCNKNFKSMIFNFNILKVSEELEEDFQVIDGVIDEKIKNYLLQLDKCSNFNINQYEVEHAPLRENICVKAGAGSGKTFSMIGRISYLIHSHKYTFKNIEEKLVLITFTNEAADNMKKKLKEYFKNYYLLTCNYDAFRIIEAIERMKISTIHSLCKKILSKYSVQLGIGKDISIVQGKYEKNKIIKEKINEYLKENFKQNDNPIEELGFQMYELEKVISNLLEKIEQKNIDLRDNYYFGKGNNKKLHDLIKTVLIRSQNELIKLNDERSSIRLSEMIIKIKELLKEAKIKKDNSNVEYLFVDEFQDSDNIQIEVMKHFGEIFKINFFVVGDIKQCIYRFRGADDDAFTKMTENDNKNWINFKLVKNYRTDTKLLDKFHPIFTRMNYTGVLKYDPNEGGDRLIGTVNLNSLNNSFFKCETYCNEEEQIKKLIKCIDEEKKKLNDNEKIAILVRTNNQIEKIKEVCKENGIGILTEGFGDLYQIKPAYDLYKLILALKHNKDPKYLFGLYDTCYIKDNIPKTELFSIRKNKDKLCEYFEDNMPIKDWDKYINKLKLQPIMKVIREIINEVKPWDNYGCNEILYESKNDMKNYYKKNLEQLIEIIVGSFNNDYITINKLEEFLNIMIFTKVNKESREDINLENISENILCTTIHKSKGLEYKVVIMPFCDEDISCKSSAGTVDIIINENNIGYSVRKISDFNNNCSYETIQNDIYTNNTKIEKVYKMNEEARILYVAMTRSIQKFIWFKNTNSKVKENWQNIIDGSK